MNRKKAVLYLEDGTAFYGLSAGADGETVGEVVFNTCMTGYLEILTDPSYNGQLVIMTYPLQGNYGINLKDAESRKPWAQGFIMREICDEPSNWTCETTLRDYLESNHIQAISDIDTRALTVKIREEGNLFAVLSTECFDEELLKQKIEKEKQKKRNLVNEAGIKEAYTEGSGSINVAVLDMGIKGSILKQLLERDTRVTVYPWNVTKEEILKSKPDGLLISNGPGDPKDVMETVNTVKSLIGEIPVCGICLGHQIIGLALGFDTYKLKFGHHGGNHPVKDLKRDRVFMTSQNHNYALKMDNIGDVEITHINLNDNTVEGIKHKKLPVASVQYHPEAAPGPLESRYIFDEFLEMIKDFKKKP